MGSFKQFFLYIHFLRIIPFFVNFPLVIPPILLCQFVVYSLLIVGVFYCTVELKSMHLYHCTYRLFAFSVMMQYIGIVILGIAWIRYGMTGLGPHTTVGSLLVGVSEIAFLLLLLLMAKGYTITRARLSSCSIVKLTIFINTYIVAYIILFIYQAEAFDPGEVCAFSFIYLSIFFKNTIFIEVNEKFLMRFIF